MLSVECGASFKFEGLNALTTECLNHSFYNCEHKIEFQFFMYFVIFFFHISMLLVFINVLLLDRF
jgi:hypothetical protein